MGEARMTNFAGRPGSRRREERSDKASYILQRNDFGIRMADTPRRFDRVEMLITRMYRQRGYKLDTLQRRASSEGSQLRAVTLEACRDRKTVGTITVSLDRAEGLQAEELYPEEIKPFRSSDNKLCEFNRLALDIEECGKEALGHLFHLTFIFAYPIHRATDLFIEVNPRHAGFYRRKLGFELLGRERICRRVEAPAVLLHQKLSFLSDQILRYGGLKIPENKSFYSFFMPPWEERQLVEEIAGMLALTQLDSDAAKASAATCVRT